MMIRMNIAEMYQLLAFPGSSSFERPHKQLRKKMLGSFIWCDFQNWYETPVGSPRGNTTSLYQQALICVVENAPVGLHQDKVRTMHLA